MERRTIIMFVAFVALLVLAYIWRRTKGKRGEMQVAALLDLLPRDRYSVINDLLIQRGGYSMIAAD